MAGQVTATLESFTTIGPRADESALIRLIFSFPKNRQIRRKQNHGSHEEFYFQVKEGIFGMNGDKIKKLKQM
jgi:hypothetical protein